MGWFDMVIFVKIGRFDGLLKIHQIQWNTGKVGLNSELRKIPGIQPKYIFWTKLVIFCYEIRILKF